MSALRHQITVDASARAVWSALTTVDGITSWWATEARVDAREGGRLVVRRTFGGEEYEDRGLFHQVRPTRALEIAWDNVGTSPSRGARLQFQVGRSGDETKVHVVISGGSGLEEEGNRERVDAFWKAAMLRLRAALED